MHHKAAAVGAGAVIRRRFVVGRFAEGLLPFSFSYERIGVGVGVRGLVPDEFHEPLVGFAFDFENDFLFQAAAAGRA
jgi:hypothetical protein